MRSCQLFNYFITSIICLRNVTETFNCAYETEQHTLSSVVNLYMYPFININLVQSRLQEKGFNNTAMESAILDF